MTDSSPWEVTSYRTETTERETSWEGGTPEQPERVPEFPVLEGMRKEGGRAGKERKPNPGNSQRLVTGASLSYAMLHEHSDSLST